MKVAIVVALFVTPVLFMGCSLNHGLTTRTTPISAVERRVDEALPVGSTRQEIEAWLTQQGIEHSFSDVPFLHSSTETMTDKNYSGVVQGILRGADRTLFVSSSILLQFVLDKDGKLKERYVNWAGTGL